MDQHAAHERVLYESLRAAWLDAGVPRQPLLVPETLALQPASLAALVEQGAEVAALGYEVEPFGATAVVVRAVPRCSRSRDPARRLCAASPSSCAQGRAGRGCRARAAAGSTPRTGCSRAWPATPRAARARCCRAEQRALADALDAIPWAPTCPHGRPVAVPVAASEIARRFGRTLSPSAGWLRSRRGGYRPAMSEPRLAPVVVVTGPTASGKSQAALELAERFGGEIVNADSMQVYRLLDVGTAKPTPAERARVPHHLFDIVDPDVQYDAGRYAREAAEARARRSTRAAEPSFLVGGSGLYIRALLEGLSVGVGRDPELRAALEERDERARERAIRSGSTAGCGDRSDRSARAPSERPRAPRARARAARRDRPRAVLVQRALAELRPWRVVQLALDPGREALALRIDRRCEAMIGGGLLQEVRSLRERGYGAELPSMRAIGYRHMQPVVDGLDTLADVLEAMKRDTRRFARRQRTWLRGVAEAWSGSTRSRSRRSSRA